MPHVLHINLVSIFSSMPSRFPLVLVSAIRLSFSPLEQHTIEWRPLFEQRKDYPPSEFQVLASMKSSQSSTRTGPRLNPILLPLLFLAFLRGQFYIASTFSGTRPHRKTQFTLRSSNPEWENCAYLLNNGLRDIGDAGRIWLKHAFVGTPANLKSDEDEDDNERYACRCQSPQVHAGQQPKLSAIVQSFNHHGNIANISQSLIDSKLVEEIIVSEDGSTDGSLHDWSDILTGKNHFVIRSNNLHELRSYNRAMRMSSGDIVVLLQDDDLLPSSDDWIHQAMDMFDNMPELGVLGGYIGQLWNHATGAGHEYGEQKSTHGGHRNGKTERIPFVEPNSNQPFMYVECAWIAPVFIRRSLLRKAGGLELTIAKRGEPGVWQDCVFSYEAWVNGYTVGVYSAPFKRGVGGHGSTSSMVKTKQRERVYERAIAYTNRKFPRRRIHEKIMKMNNDTLKPRL